MKPIAVILVLVLCASVTVGLEQQSDKVTSNKVNNENIEGDKEVNQEDIENSGSLADEDTNEGSAESGSEESGDEEDEGPPSPQLPFPNPTKFKYYNFRTPLTITPLEPMVNRQKPYRRRCFFCFPRGLLGRVEVTAPGGPYLMNGFGPMTNGFGPMTNGFGPMTNGFGPIINGFGPMNGYGMDYPDTGFPSDGPGYPDMEYPPMGGFGGGSCCGSGPCCGGPCRDEGSNDGPMIFQGIEEPRPPSKGPAIKVHDKTMPQPTNKAMKQLPNKATPEALNKAMDQPPNKAMDQTPNKAMDQPPNKATDQTPNKAMDQPPNKATDQPSSKATDQPLSKATDQLPNKEADQDNIPPLKKLNDKNKSKLAEDE